jgi:hypothetical protein
VEGTVRNLKTGELLADVRVTLVQELTAPPPTPTAVASKTATTDADGKFTITAVPPGRYLVNATRTLFFRSRRDSGPAALTLAEGQRLTGVQILLSPTSVIAGRVIDDRREPLRSVRVEALRREFRDGLRTWVAAGQSTTGDRGEYRLFNLTPGTYYVRAAQSSMPPLYYPGTPDSQSAVPVSVDVGAEAGSIDLEMRRSPEYSLQLTLGGVPTGSTANFTMRRKNALANEQQGAEQETVSGNTYRIGHLVPGAYDLFVQVGSIVPTGTGAQSRVLTNAGSIPVSITNTNLDLGTVAIPSTVAVAGRILVPDPLPSPLVAERLVLTMRALDVAAPIAASARGNSAPPGINSDGTFTLPHVAAARYQVQLTGLPADTFLISAREGTRDVLDTGFTVTGSQNLLELTVGGPGSVGSVLGTVVNALGRPVSPGTVVLVPAPERRSNPAAFRTATTDQSGNFIIRSVLAGDYRVLGFEDIEPGIHLDPEFLKGFETRGEAIKVQRGSQNTVTLRVIPAQ